MLKLLKKACYNFAKLSEDEPTRPARPFSAMQAPKINFPGSKDPFSILDERQAPTPKKPFNLEEFKQIKDMDKAINYATESLNSVTSGKGQGIGSSRLAFKLGGGKILKVARVPAGIAQNHMEARLSGRNDFFAKVFDMEKSGLWIISEEIFPFNIVQFINETEIPIEMLSDPAIKFNIYRPTPEFFQDLQERHNLSDKALNFFKDVCKMVSEFGLLHGDTFNIPSVGHWGKNSQGEIKFLDYGLDARLYNHYYERGGLKTQRAKPEPIEGEISAGDVSTVRPVNYSHLKVRAS